MLIWGSFWPLGNAQTLSHSHICSQYIFSLRLTAQDRCDTIFCKTNEWGKSDINFVSVRCWEKTGNIKNVFYVSVCLLFILYAKLETLASGSLFFEYQMRSVGCPQWWSFKHYIWQYSMNNLKWNNFLICIIYFQLLLALQKLQKSNF